MKTIYETFKMQVEARPDALAVMDEQRQLTYAELDRLVDTLIAQFPVKNPVFVGVVMDHSVEMIAALLAVLKSGAAYIPAEPTFPQERIRYMMKEADTCFVITQERYADYINSGLRKMLVETGTAISPSAPIQPDRSQPDALAYILYTSGTTGSPKGVKVTNANVCHYVRAFANEFHPQEGDRMLQHSVCSFDIFVEEVFTTLCNGAVLCIPTEETKADIGRLMGFIERNEVTMLSGFPYLLLEMNKLPEIPKCLRLLISGGDVIRARYIDRLRSMGPMIYNTYGPSETTVCASYFRVDNAEPLEDGTFSIGKPVLGTDIAILDDNLQPVKDGEVGKICISGGGVSLGYMGSKPEQENFVVTADGGRLYRSGDLGYRLPDGNLAFLHRKDKQVMIMGKRVECDEVENLLCTCSEVETAVVSAHNDTQGLSYLTAYIVPRRNFSLTELKRKLSKYLTAFMIPEYFVLMPAIPLNTNGKPDRQSLPIIIKESRLYA